MTFMISAMANSSDSNLPTDGRNGYLWNSNITFPVYPSSANPDGGYQNITWATLDKIFNQNEQVNSTAGICFGLCLLAFLNMIALTPKAKRGLPLFIFNLLALATLTARYLTIMITYTALETGSAYYNIAADYADGETIQSIIGIVFGIWLPPFALIFVVICFYLQGRCVLVLMAMKRRKLYLGILGYLLGIGLITIALRIIYASYITVNYFEADFFVPDWLATAVLALYSATIFSWSLVFSWQVGLCIFNRSKIRAPVDRQEAMAILFMTGVESMLVPIIFTILQFCDISWFLLPEYLILPSVACIIPFGSIWAGAAATNANLAKATHLVETPTRCGNCSELLDHGPTSGPSMSAYTNAFNEFAASPRKETGMYTISPYNRLVERNSTHPPISTLPYSPDKISLGKFASSGANLPTVTTSSKLLGTVHGHKADIRTGLLVNSTAAATTARGEL